MRYKFLINSEAEGSFLFMQKLYKSQLGRIGLIGSVVVGLGLTIHALAPYLAVVASQSAEPELAAMMFDAAVIFLLGFVCHYLAQGSSFPSFVIAILVGMAVRPLLHPFLENELNLALAVTVGATLILFQGGLETPFANFRKLFPKIFMLAFPGVLLTAFLLSVVVLWGAGALDIVVTPTVAVLLGAILASTDPAAIVPLLKGLRFKDPATKDIVVSESALNDVVGALLTLVFVGFVVGGNAFESLPSAYQQLTNVNALIILAKQFTFGVIAGLIGYGLIRFLARHKRDHEQTHAVDTAFFFAVPIIVFPLALLVGGSGYLAAFVAGLMTHLEEHLGKIEEFFNDVIDGFVKPLIFGLLGALVEPTSLLQYAGIGLLAAAAFIFVIRPLVVFLMLGGFAGAKQLSFGQLLFISFVRETGAIPAVLLVTVVGLGLPNVEPLVPIGMWVILMTLLVLPPITPWLARKTGVAE